MADFALAELTKKDQTSWSGDIRQFIEWVPIPMCLLDDEGLMCHANSEFFSSIAQLGRLKNKDFIKSIIHVDSRDQMYTVLEEAIKCMAFKKTIRCKTLVYQSTRSYSHSNDCLFRIADWTVNIGLEGVLVMTASFVEDKDLSIGRAQNISETSPSLSDADGVFLALVPPLGKRKVLLVDDSPICLRILNKLIQGMGFETDFAEDGSVAYDILKVRAEEFELVFMDFRMPIVDGLEATLKCRESGINIPIIILTAEPQINFDSALHVGANFILEKPASLTEIQRALLALSISF